jgi:flavin-dependent dehydrogenase
MGCTSAHVAAKVANDALAKGDLSARRLFRYKSALDRGVGRELRKAHWLRRAFLGLSDADLDRLARTFQDPKVRAVANRHGDIDFPSRLVLPLLMRRPSMVRYVGPALRGAIFGGR